MNATLLERLEGATGPDRELDFALGKTLDHVPANAEWQGPEDGSLLLWPGTQEYPGVGTLPSYTASIDAALALVERVLPGWRPSMQQSRAGQFDCYLHSKDETGWLRQSHGEAWTLPLAILIATLKALAKSQPSQET